MDTTPGRNFKLILEPGGGSGAAQFLGMEDVAPDGAGLILAFYYK
jgi:hypothetical protein